MVNDCLVVRARFTFMILLSQSVLGARSISLVFLTGCRVVECCVKFIWITRLVAFLVV